MNEYMHTDTAEDLISTLELSCEFLTKSCLDDRYWKWFIYSVHAAVQSTAALSLAGGNGFLVQKPSVMKRMLEAHANDGEPVAPHMDNFSRLIEKTLIKQNLWCHAEPILDTGHIKALQTLDELLDEFTHFNVKSWAIEKLHILECTNKAIDFVHHYVCVTYAIIWHEESYQKRVVLAIGTLKSELEKLCIESCSKSMND